MTTLSKIGTILLQKDGIFREGALKRQLIYRGQSLIIKNTLDRLFMDEI